MDPAASMHSFILSMGGLVLLIVLLFLGGQLLPASFAKSVLNLDRRIIYAFVAILVFTPIIKPLGLSFAITKEVQDAYNTIEHLAPGTPIIISSDYGAATMPETHPMYIALLHQCFKKKLRPIILTMVPDGPGITSIGLRTVLQSKNPAGALNYPNLQSGIDYAYLGYKPNATAAILGMVQSFSGTFPTDYYGKQTKSMPIFKDVHSLKDVGAVFDIAAVAMPEYWVNYGTQRTGVPLAVSVTAVSAVQYYPFYRAGQFVGLVNGMKGSAEYEKLVGEEQITGQVGDATKGMDAQSVVHVFIVLSILLANLAIFVQRRTARGATA